MHHEQIVTIRKAVLADLPAITAIYNEAILNTTATMDTETKTVDNRKDWFEAHGAQQPIFVAEAKTTGQIVGWASLSRWSDRVAYRYTAETSLYVHADHRGQGIGRTLNDKLIVTAQELGYHNLIARITGDNARSIQMHKLAGFELVGTMRNVGYKFEMWLDVHILQNTLVSV